MRYHEIPRSRKDIILNFYTLEDLKWHKFITLCLQGSIKKFDTYKLWLDTSCNVSDCLLLHRYNGLSNPFI